MAATSQASRHPDFEFDLKHGPEHDLSHRSFQKFLRARILDGSLRGLWIGLPCNSFSTARNRPNGPATLRTARFPLGFPGLKPWDEKAARTGNAHASFCGGLLRLARRSGVPLVIENPGQSWVWSHPSLLLPSSSSSSAPSPPRDFYTDYCMDGTAWRKRTRFRSVNVDLGPAV